MSGSTTTAPETRAEPGMEEAVVGLLAEFENPGALLRAAEKIRDAGFTRWDCHSPFAVHGLDRAMGIRMTSLPLLVFCCGAFGALVGFVLQWFTNATQFSVFLPMEVSGYQFPISGKPILSGSVYPIVMFELMVLFSAFGAVFGMLGFNRLPKLYNPLFKSRRFARVTTDMFFIAIDAADGKFDRDQTEALLRESGATAIEEILD